MDQNGDSTGNANANANDVKMEKKTKAEKQLEKDQLNVSRMSPLMFGLGLGLILLIVVMIVVVAITIQQRVNKQAFDNGTLTGNPVNAGNSNVIVNTTTGTTGSTGSCSTTSFSNLNSTNPNLAQTNNLNRNNVNTTPNNNERKSERKNQIPSSVAILDDLKERQQKQAELEKEKSKEKSPGIRFATNKALVINPVKNSVSNNVIDKWQNSYFVPIVNKSLLSILNLKTREEQQNKFKNLEKTIIEDTQLSKLMTTGIKQTQSLHLNNTIQDQFDLCVEEFLSSSFSLNEAIYGELTSFSNFNEDRSSYQDKKEGIETKLQAERDSNLEKFFTNIKKSFHFNLAGLSNSNLNLNSTLKSDNKNDNKNEIQFKMDNAVSHLKQSLNNSKTIEDDFVAIIQFYVLLRNSPEFEWKKIPPRPRLWSHPKQVFALTFKTLISRFIADLFLILIKSKNNNEKRAHQVVEQKINALFSGFIQQLDQTIEFIFFH